MERILLLPLVIPAAAALICLVLPKHDRGFRSGVALLALLASLVFALVIFLQPARTFSTPWLQITPGLAVPFVLRSAPFARLVLAATPAFGLLVYLYALKPMQGHARRREFTVYFLLVISMTGGAVLADNLILMLFFWEINGLLLYLLAGINGEEAVRPASKTFIMTGVGDLALLLGIGLLWMAGGSLSISATAAQPLVLSGWMAPAAYIFMLLGAFAKAGAVPMHTWIPAIAQTTPATVMAFLPASLDKLLGIYLLALISLQLFVMTPIMGAVLMVVGAVTILGGVLMALIQHEFRRMLAFHAVSQVGYMVLGIGTGVPVGVLGGIFHMLNHAIYKSCLFLCGGSVQRQTGKTHFSDLGGLASSMPWTFAASLVAALAISGVPPMNGFVSKWMVYQGILEQGKALQPVFLVIAMLGSALTLASFMKLLYSLFWGERPAGQEAVRETHWTMVIPMTALAIACLGLGIFYPWAVARLIVPIAGISPTEAILPGLWQSETATLLLIASLAAGLLIYFVGRPGKETRAAVFLGGEALDPALYRVPGSHFYGPVKNMDGLKQVYQLAERGMFDIYEQGVLLIKRLSHWVYQNIDQALADFYQDVIPALISLIGQVLHALNRGMVLTYLLWGLYALGGAASLALPGQDQFTTLTRVVACSGMLGWAFLAWVETDLRRMLLLAATSQAGFVLLAITLSPAVAVSYLATSATALLILSLDAYVMQRRYRTAIIGQMGGLAARMPVAFIIFLLAALWLSGLPPFLSFFSKFLLGVAAGEISPFLTIAVTGAAILTLAYLLRPLRNFLRNA